MKTCVPLITPQDCDPEAPSPAPIPGPDTDSPAPPPADGSAGQAPNPVTHFHNPDLPTGWHVPEWHIHLPTVSEALATLGTGLAAVGFVLAAGVGMNAVACWRRWEARQVRNYAAGTVILPAGAVVVSESWTEPARLWWQGAQVLAHHGPCVAAVVALTTGALPVAWGAAAVYRARLLDRLHTRGVGSPARTRRLMRRQQLGKARAARAAARYRAPLTTGWLHSQVVLGTLSERTNASQPGALTQLVDRRTSRLQIPVNEVGHMFCVGKSQHSGKTTTQIRLGVGMYAAFWHRYVRTGERRPLLIFVDCKGGKPGLVTGRHVVKIAARLGVAPSRIALWPITNRLDLWSMDIDDMCATLEAMINPTQANDLGQEHFKHNRIRVTKLAVTAPCGPPRSSREFLDRLSVPWLQQQWAGNESILTEIDALQQSKPPAVGDVSGKFRNIFAAIGEGFDGGRGLDSFDVLYATVPGTVRKEYARAQVAALTTLVKQFACADHNRQIVLIIDEMSAVADKTGGIDQVDIAERLLGMGVVAVFVAQNQYGFGATLDERRRLMEACPSGGLIMAQDGADKVAEIFGTRPVAEATAHTLGNRYGTEGSVGSRDTYFIDPNRLREFGRGDLVWVRGLKADWGHVIPVDPDTLTPLPRDPAAHRWTVGTAPRVPLQTVRDTDVNPVARRADLGFTGEGGQP